MPDAVTFCEQCHRETTTVLGKCTNCWYVKEPSAVPARRTYRAPLWDGDDLAAVVLAWSSFAPGLVALVVGLLLDVPALIAIGGGLLAVRLLGPFVLDNFW